MVDANEGGILFLDAPGRTGKTFSINLILAKLRSEGKIALATASSGIAATLLTGGRTLHSTFHCFTNPVLLLVYKTVNYLFTVRLLFSKTS